MLELSPLEIEALRLSLRVGACSVVVSLPLGLAAAFLLARGRFPGKIVLDGLVHLPLVLPPVVVGFALLVLFGRHGPIGGFLFDRFGITFAFNWKGAALASAVMALPADGARHAALARAASTAASRRPRGRWAPAGRASSSPSPCR